MACLTWRFQQLRAAYAVHCIVIFHESTGQEEIDPLSIAAEDSRLMWAQYCLGKYCAAETHSGTPSKAGSGQVLLTIVLSTRSLQYAFGIA